MSTDSNQADLNMRAPPEPHLRLKLETGSASNLGADHDRGEYFCSGCRKRITRNSKNANEYGHARTCDHHQVFTGGSS